MIKILHRLLFWGSFVWLALVSGIFCSSCTKRVWELPPTITTSAVTSITTSSASCGGDVVSDGDATITARGVCWNTTGSPTMKDSLTTDGTGKGSFTSHITGLSPNSSYFVRAYATNKNGTAYGATEEFKTTGIYLDESFSTGLGGFTAQSVSGDQVWSWIQPYGACMSGYSGGLYLNEDWLISPAMDLSSANNAILRFSHAINKGDIAHVTTNHTVWISKSYTSGLPVVSDWEQLTVPGYPTGDNWNFVASGDVLIPAAYCGQVNVRFAFKFLSSITESATWEIKDVSVMK